MELLYKFFAAIEASVTQPWLAIPLKVVIVAVMLLGALTVARLLAIKFWVEVSVRVERRIRYSDILESASEIGARVGNPGWRSNVPRSWANVERRSPVWLLRYSMARRLVRQIPLEKLERMTKRRNALEQLSRIPKRAVGFASRRSLILLASGAAVYQYERPGRTRDDLQIIADEIPRIAEQRTWAPILVLTVGVFAITRSGSLIDRIRARDEAAKDANRMLAELLATLSELDVALQEVHENINAYRSAYLDVASGAAESGRAWSPGFGFESDHYGLRVSLYGRKSLEILLEEPEFQRLQCALDAAADHLAEIREKGISSVALRILSPVWQEIYSCRLQSHLYHPTSGYTAGIKYSMLGLGWMKERLETKERHFGHLSKKDGRDDGELDAKLVEEAYRLDDLILRSRLAHCQLQKIRRFLLKRLHGTSLTKLVSAVGHR
ncbi:hypothetical protein [Streptomyces alkaliterrae]|uniref:Uncharacterized protein n=1 Tax=Streptomyces alkaliterrae TaxID=2213162 RepID=A0A5P0YNF1_9ACTN|nr:hypothetical protein [Streptomyces alkaliterrae]MBB1259383.1 hypothetical protein [Streptomyces alkaliterrae]MQS01768.1 hypothetical protein [Streptomyces alkaliterrae]